MGTQTKIMAMRIKCYELKKYLGGRIKCLNDQFEVG